MKVERRPYKEDYKAEELLSYLAEDTKKEKLAALYREYYIKDKTRDVEDKKGIAIYNFIAGELIKLDNDLEKYFDDNIKEIERTPRKNGKCYFTEGHDSRREKEKAQEKIKNILPNDELEEVWLAKSLLLEKYQYIGEIKDYQVPIIETNKIEDDEEVKFAIGNIDLLAYNENDDIISLIELKNRTNTETLLRAILEIATYYCQISKSKLKSEYSRKNGADTKVWKVVLIYEDGEQYKQYTNKDSENIRILADKLKVKIFFLDRNNQIAEIK